MEGSQLTISEVDGRKITHSQALRSRIMSEPHGADDLGRQAVSVIVAESIFVRNPEVILWVVGVPAALWAVIIGAFVYSGKWRRFAFGAAVLVGGIGLIWGIGASTTEIPDDGGLGAYGRGIGAVLGIFFGAGLLLIGALLGSVALFLGRDKVDSAPSSIGKLIGGQPKSEDSVDSNGRGDWGI